MSKKNYNRISTERAKAFEKPVEPVVEVVDEVDEVVVQECDNRVEEPIFEKVEGVVANCSKLNIRKQPNPNAEIIGTINSGAKVIIHEEVGDFYKIGDSEFCMKKFISVKK